MTSFSWTGNDLLNPTDFSDAENWSPTGGPPHAGDDATIRDDATLAPNQAVTITQASEVDNLAIDDAALHDNGFVLTVDNELIVGLTATTNGTSNSLLSVGGTGGEIDTGWVDIGEDPGSNGQVTVNGPGTLAATTAIVVGDQGWGYLYLFGGGSVTAGTFIAVGENASSNGLLSINDSTVSVTAEVVIGVEAGGDGSFAASGNIQLSNDAQLTVGSFMSVGINGIGTLGIGPGSVVDVGPQGGVSPGGGTDFGIGVGDDEGGYGTVTVDGTGSQLNVSRAIVVGGALSNGGNSLTITDGAVVNANVSGDAETENLDALAVAGEQFDVQSYGEDQITVDGQGSVLDANGTMVVGVNGMAEIDVTAGAQLMAKSYPGKGVSGLGQNVGASGTIDVEGGSLYTDDNLKVGDAGAGTLNVTGDSFVGITSDLAIGVQAGSDGTVQVGDSSLSPDTSGLFTGSINVGGDFASDDSGGAGGTGVLTVEDDARVGIGQYLNVWGSVEATGTVDLYSLTGGVVEVGFFPTDESASQFAGDLVLNPTGILQLENGVIEGGTLDFNGGTFNVTSDQIDDEHNVLQDVTIEGQDLSVTDAVLTLADGTYGNVTGLDDVPDNVLIDATGSVIDLRQDFGAEYLRQIVNLTDTALTVDASAPDSSDLAGATAAVTASGPNFAITSTGVIDGTGAIFSDYVTPSGGFFSGDVDLDNQGLIDAQANDGSQNESVPGHLSILTNIINNDAAGTFEADPGATLDIGQAPGGNNQPLDATHVFNNLVDTGDGTSLIDGLYDANGGTISINGYDSAGNLLNPISTLSAVLHLTGQNGANGDLLVNGTPIEDTLTTVAPSTDAGEGDLSLLYSDFTFEKVVTVEGLAANEPAGWTINNSGIGGAGGILYLDQGTFSGPGLVIDAATDGGQAAAIDGDGAIDAPVTMDGTTTVHDYGGGNILEFADAVTGSGQYAISGGTALWFNQTLGNPGDPASENTVTFDDDPGGASLWIGATDVTDGFRATIDDFGPNDDIDLLNVTGASAVLDSVNHQIDVLDGAGHVIATLQVDDSIPDGTTFQTSPFAGGTTGTTIRYASPPCYCRGTLIATDRGDVAVEDLAIGDRIVTRAGTARPIKWIGKRSYGGRFLIGRDDILPVCIKAGALDDNVPRRDLWISPHHAMYLDGVLIEARDLINGLSIVQATDAAHVEYFHVELDSHDALLAEGAWSETFIDDDSRGIFHNAHEFAALYPDAVPANAQYCAPRCSEGYAVETARRRIEQRAGLHGASDLPLGTLRGRIETVTAHRIAGWAQNVEHPEAAVCLDILAGSRLIGQVLANRLSDDGLGEDSRRHGFVFTPPAGLSFAPQAIAVRRSLDGASLEASAFACESRAAVT